MSDLRTQASIYRYEKSILRGIDRNAKTDTQKDIEKAMRRNRDVVSLGGKATTNLGFIPQDILDILNFNQDELDAVNYLKLKPGEEYFIIRDVRFTREQIPEVPLERCETYMAKGNVLSFETGKYYKFTGTDGKIHRLACVDNYLLTPYSERIRDIIDREGLQEGYMWNILAAGQSAAGLYPLGLYYSHNEVEEAIKSVGVTEGFFTVKVGNNSGEFFYSEEGNPPIVPKRSYDNDYKGITEYGTITMRNECAPGDIIVVDGKEYTLREDHTLNIPYGIDIYDMQYPEYVEKRIRELIRKANIELGADGAAER